MKKRGKKRIARPSYKKLYLAAEAERLRLDKMVGALKRDVEENVKLVNKGWARANFYRTQLMTLIDQGVSDMTISVLNRGGRPPKYQKGP